MQDWREPLRSSLKKSLDLLWLVAKIIIPLSVLIVFLDYIGFVQYVSRGLAPVTAAFGLPGEATLPLMFGFFINVYASVGSLSVITLSGPEVTLVGMMVLICHELPVETVIARHTGLKIFHSIALRLSMALISGLLLGLIYRLAGVI